MSSTSTIFPNTDRIHNNPNKGHQRINSLNINIKPALDRMDTNQEGLGLSKISQVYAGIGS